MTDKKSDPFNWVTFTIVVNARKFGEKKILKTVFIYNLQCLTRPTEKRLARGGEVEIGNCMRKK